jgi:hypothetical protein
LISMANVLPGVLDHATPVYVLNLEPRPLRMYYASRARNFSNYARRPSHTGLKQIAPTRDEHDRGPEKAAEYESP